MKKKSIILSVAGIVILLAVIICAFIFISNNSDDSDNDKKSTNKPAESTEIKQEYKFPEEAYGEYRAVSGDYSYLALIIDDKTYNIYDCEAGNPGIVGTYEVVDEDTLRFIDKSDEDFDPPFIDFERDDTVDYTYNNGILTLSSHGTTIEFKK